MTQKGETMSTNGPAFPHMSKGGMSKRDYIAAQAMVGDMANSDGGVFGDDAPREVLLKRARLYYRMADAMLEVSAEDDI